MKLAAALCFSLSLLTASAPSFAAEKKTIRFGVADGKGKQSAAESFGPFLKQMNASSSAYTLQMVVFDDGDKQYQALKDGKVDLAFFGPATYVKARYEFKAEPVVAEAGDLRSMLVVKKSSPIRSASELRGKTVAFGYEGSTTTHLLPMLLLSKNRLKSVDLGRVIFVGDQTLKIVDAVMNGTAAAGGISENLYLANQDKLRVLETSESLPGALIAASPKLGAKTTQELRGLFVRYVPSPGVQRFTKGAVTVSDATYNRVRFLYKVVLGRMYL